MEKKLPLEKKLNDMDSRELIELYGKINDFIAFLETAIIKEEAGENNG